jgi:hypothetical protein
MVLSPSLVHSYTDPHAHEAPGRPGAAKLISCVSNHNVQSPLDEDKLFVKSSASYSAPLIKWRIVVIKLFFNLNIILIRKTFAYLRKNSIYKSRTTHSCSIHIG